MVTVRKAMTAFKHTISRLKEAEKAVKRAEYREYLADYKPGWVMYTDFRRSFLSKPSNKDLDDFACAGCDYIVFYKPGLFPTSLDRLHGLVRYRRWVEQTWYDDDKTFRFTDADFDKWLLIWEEAAKTMVHECHKRDIGVLMQASNGFNFAAHVYHKQWFDPTLDPMREDLWMVGPEEKPVDALAGSEWDFLIPNKPSTEYIKYCEAAASDLIIKFNLDGLYYDDNASVVPLLRATADVAHAHKCILLNHHSADDMTHDHFEVPDYWLTGESLDFRNPMEYFRRRQSDDEGHFLNCVAISNENWGPTVGPPEATVEEIGFGFLMCALKFPVLYPPALGATDMWRRFLTLYKQVMKPGTTAFIWVTECDYILTKPNQLRPFPVVPEKAEFELAPRLFCSLFVNERIFMIFVNNGPVDETIELTSLFENLDSKEKIKKVTLKSNTVLVLGKV